MFEQLVIAAKEAYNKAYAPYSNFHVGAAALTTEGQIVNGCNVENASYGLTVCAERNCIAQGVIQGQRKFTELVVYTEEDVLTPPCGACRQVIVEFMAQNAKVYAVNHAGEVKLWSVAELLPDAFTPENLQK
ncbi:cytidine deaminase [Thalassotalea eurytherma]|uniref:Cytidine deaminase n=1 Tax=Thalassotalea eurytherma TaxID=1144278 RepID=A0ABQ6H670_9GAMM|nr:cytidine deaminase [Thalassotalea eurytherma]GLX83655.1 cytidine deaminase [Thalassotalea eurytherma]